MYNVSYYTSHHVMLGFGFYFRVMSMHFGFEQGRSGYIGNRTCTFGALLWVVAAIKLDEN